MVLMICLCNKDIAWIVLIHLSKEVYHLHERRMNERAAGPRRPRHDAFSIPAALQKRKPAMQPIVFAQNKLSPALETGGASVSSSITGEDAEGDPSVTPFVLLFPAYAC
jgi:hypothetical protein